MNKTLEETVSDLHGELTGAFSCLLAEEDVQALAVACSDGRGEAIVRVIRACALSQGAIGMEMPRDLGTCERRFGASWALHTLADALDTTVR